MKNVLILAFIVFVFWKLFGDNQPIQETTVIQESVITMHERVIQQPKYECDGRQHCSQMTSCAEATYFIQHCPDTKMDGDRDGVPCERQWCQ